jgi:hypothetical protein
MVPTGPATTNMVSEGVTLFKVKLSNQNVFLIKIDIIKGKLCPLVKLTS